MHQRSHRLVAASLSLLIAVGASGCSGDAGTSSASPSTSPPTSVAVDPATLSPEELARLSVEWERDPRILAERAATPDDAAFAFGQELVLTDDGPRPARLVAIVDTEVVVRNETGAPTWLVFDNGTVGADELERTPVIEPGGEVRFTPTRAVSITYHVGDDASVGGHLQIDTGQW